MNWTTNLYCFWGSTKSQDTLLCSCFVSACMKQVSWKTSFACFQLWKTYFWSSAFIFLLLIFWKCNTVESTSELKLLTENVTVNWYLGILYFREIVYLSWDQSRYDKDMKRNHQNSIPQAYFSSRLSRSKSHQLSRELHCFTPDTFLFRCAF